MKKYQISYTTSARNELIEAFHWLRNESPLHADPWREGIISAIESLETFPERCSLSPENEFFVETIYQLYYGKHHGTYRLLFKIVDDRVYILHIRHGARKMLKPEEDK